MIEFQNPANNLHQEIKKEEFANEMMHTKYNKIEAIFENRTTNKTTPAMWENSRGEIKPYANCLRGKLQSVMMTSWPPARVGGCGGLTPFPLDPVDPLESSWRVTILDELRGGARCR